MVGLRVDFLETDTLFSGMATVRRTQKPIRSHCSFYGDLIGISEGVSSFYFRDMDLVPA